MDDRWMIKGSKGGCGLIGVCGWIDEWVDE